MSPCVGSSYEETALHMQARVGGEKTIEDYGGHKNHDSDSYAGD